MHADLRATGQRWSNTAAAAAAATAAVAVAAVSPAWHWVTGACAHK